MFPVVCTLGGGLQQITLAECLDDSGPLACDGGGAHRFPGGGGGPPPAVASRMMAERGVEYVRPNDNVRMSPEIDYLSYAIDLINLGNFLRLRQGRSAVC